MLKAKIDLLDTVLVICMPESFGKLLPIFKRCSQFHLTLFEKRKKRRLGLMWTQSKSII